MSRLQQWMDVKNIDLYLTAQSEMDAIVEMLSLMEKSGVARNLKYLACDLLHHKVRLREKMIKCNCSESPSRQDRNHHY